MNIEEFREVATPIIVAGFEAGKEDDDIKMELMVAKVPYSALNTVVKTIMIESGCIVDPKVVSDELGGKIESVDWEAITEWEQLSDICNKLADDTEGATFARALTLARAYAKNEMDLALPKKPRGTGGGGKGRVGTIAKAVVELLAENDSPTKQEFYDVMATVVGGDQQHANILYYMGLHQGVAMAIAQGRPLEEVVAELAQQANPAPGEGVSAVPRGESAPVVTDDDEEDFED